MATVFDEERFCERLDEVRRVRGLTWKQVAQEAGVSASTACRARQGKGLSTGSLALLLAWSGLSGDEFIARDRGVLDPEVEIWSLIRQMEVWLGRLPKNRKVARALDHLDECRMWLESLESDEWSAEEEG